MKGTTRIRASFRPREIDRLKRAAGIRELSVAEFVRQSALAWSDDTLAPIRVEPADPWDRIGSSTATEHRLVR
jgi:uncharacterized protein (DUF1778 family)